MINCEYPCVQVFSRQAVQMDALISAFVEDIKQRAALYNEDSEGNLFTDNAVNEADGNRKILFELTLFVTNFMCKDLREFYAEEYVHMYLK